MDKAIELVGAYD
jgi:hypothetical protein